MQIYNKILDFLARAWFCFSFLSDGFCLSGQKRAGNVAFLSKFVPKNIVSNALLIAHDYCPISYRTVDSVDYKKAMLIFYEQNNLSAFKKIFIDQFVFATNQYF